MEREDAYTFDCRILPFSLESKPDGGRCQSTTKRCKYKLIDYIAIYYIATVTVYICYCCDLGGYT